MANTAASDALKQLLEVLQKGMRRVPLPSGSGTGFAGAEHRINSTSKSLELPHSQHTENRKSSAWHGFKPGN